MDMLFPGTNFVCNAAQCDFNLSQVQFDERIKYNSKLEHEYITHFKILQVAFKKMKVDQVSKNIFLKIILTSK